MSSHKPLDVANKSVFWRKRKYKYVEVRKYYVFLKYMYSYMDTYIEQYIHKRPLYVIMDTFVIIATVN